MAGIVLSCTTALWRLVGLYPTLSADPWADLGPWRPDFFVAA